jgi:ribosomal protein RSM22 (predicted rRNA methylase)
VPLGYEVPVELERAALRAARDVLGDDPLTTPALVRAIVDRSLRYTSERARLARPGDSRGDLAARAAFFTIADAMKIAIPLGELAGRDAVPMTRPLRLLDVGAGCGAMTLGLIAALRVDLAVTAIDRDADALAIASAAVRDFAASVGVTVAFESRTSDVSRAPLPVADLIVLGSVLNELPEAAALAVVERALAAIEDDGAVVIVEPALRDTSRALHAIRDAVIARGAGHVFAPCTRRTAPCPALAEPDDWCHEDRRVALPPHTRELARLTHLRDGGMKFAYLVLRRQPTDLVVGGDAAWRIVSAPRLAKGKLEIFGCGARGRYPLRRLKRHRSDTNRELDRAERGDVLVLEPGESAGDRVEITEDTKVIRIAPARVSTRR